MGLAWWLGEALAVVAICGIAWAKACFVRGQFVFFFPVRKRGDQPKWLDLSGRRWRWRPRLGRFRHLVHISQPRRRSFHPFLPSHPA